MKLALNEEKLKILKENYDTIQDLVDFQLFDIQKIPNIQEKFSEVELWNEAWYFIGIGNLLGDPLVINFEDGNEFIEILNHDYKWVGSEIASSLDEFHFILIQIHQFNSFFISSFENLLIEIQKINSNIEIEVWRDILNPLFKKCDKNEKKVLNEMKKMFLNGLKINEISNQIELDVKTIYQLKKKL